LLTSNTELTYSENEVCGSVRANSKMPMTLSSDNSAELCQTLSVRPAAAGVVAAVVFFTGGTSGNVIAATTVHIAHSAEAMMLIQKNVA
jgi:hypothetical protein